MNQPDPAKNSNSSPALLCVVCGQVHSPEENHFYTYTEDVDDDLVCHICLQALLDPLDTPCGHTYCTLCLTNFLVEKDFCPVDRQPVLLQWCKKSNILVNKLLNKLLVTCPFTEYCTEVVQRGDLQQHFQTRYDKLWDSFKKPYSTQLLWASQASWWDPWAWHSNVEGDSSVPVSLSTFGTNESVDSK